MITFFTHTHAHAIVILWVHVFEGEGVYDLQQF